MSNENQNDNKAGENPGVGATPDAGEVDVTKDPHAGENQGEVKPHPEEGQPNTLTPPIEERRDPERMAQHEQDRKSMTPHEVATENIALSETHEHPDPRHANARGQRPGDGARLMDSSEEVGDRFLIHNVAKKKGKNGTRSVVHVGPQQVHLDSTPLTMSRAQVTECADELKEKEAQGLIEVKTPDGARVDLQTLKAMGPAPRHQITHPREQMDSVNNDKNFKYPPGYIHSGATYFADDTQVPQVLADGAKPSLFASAADQAMVAASMAQQAGTLLPNEDAEHLAAQKRAGTAATRSSELAAMDDARDKREKGEAFRAHEIVGLAKEAPEITPADETADDRIERAKQRKDEDNERAVKHLDMGDDRVHGTDFEHHPELLPKDPRNENPVTHGLHDGRVEQEQDEEEDDMFENPEDHPEAGVEPREGAHAVQDQVALTGELGEQSDAARAARGEKPLSTKQKRKLQEQAKKNNSQQPPALTGGTKGDGK